MTSPNDSGTNGLLGYPVDARLLIVNADDFGMCHSVNEAVVRAWKDGVVSSTTLMAPCPWAPHAMRLLAENPDIPFGVHLTVVCDFPHYRWGPLAPRPRRQASPLRAAPARLTRRAQRVGGPPRSRQRRVAGPGAHHLAGPQDRPRLPGLPGGARHPGRGRDHPPGFPSPAEGVV